MNETIMYYTEDAIDFICDRSNFDRETVSKILELELEYMDSIGLVAGFE